MDNQNSARMQLEQNITNVYKLIAPWWPLKNVIANNPLQGLHDQPFEQALQKGQKLFEYTDIPQELYEINQVTIRWVQMFFDQGQSTLHMPYRDQGLYQSFKKLAVLDSELCKGDSEVVSFLHQLPDDLMQAVEVVLKKLSIKQDQQELFLTAILTTLPGWASYAVYCADWAPGEQGCNKVSKVEYLLVRLILISIRWPEAQQLVDWFEQQQVDQQKISQQLETIKKDEDTYRSDLLQKLSTKIIEKKSEPVDAQFIFCMDVRSEIFRRHLEQQANYETYSMAGFFGLPMSMQNIAKGTEYAACPVLLKPKHHVREHMICSNFECKLYEEKKLSIKYVFDLMYRSLKYTFAAPFVLVEVLGPWALVWMIWQSINPVKAIAYKSHIRRHQSLKKTLWPDLTSISLHDRQQYALQALRLMGMVKNFVKIVVIAGHGRATENNAYASSLDCGACGGYAGLNNAKMLATILNDRKVRKFLAQHEINIPQTTYFVAAEHVTTTDQLELYDDKEFENVDKELLQQLKKDLSSVQERSAVERLQSLQERVQGSATQQVLKKSCSWSQVRPEWGLSNNASFIIGPRTWTKQQDLQGRSFLHSYDWTLDVDGSILESIITAPMVVASWINLQYLFSSLDPVAYGSGSKATQNIVGKIGVMQGNASDLMTGLPMQSVMVSDTESYHEPIRLQVCIYAPKQWVIDIVSKHENIQQLVQNQWLFIQCLDPQNSKMYQI